MNSDPRVFFAAERTSLAWVRSGLTVMALGFVVAKFRLFLTLLSASSAAKSHLHQNSGLSNIFGIALVIVGATITVGAQYNHRFYVSTLPPEVERQPPQAKDLGGVIRSAGSGRIKPAKLTVS